MRGLKLYSHREVRHLLLLFLFLFGCLQSDQTTLAEAEESRNNFGSGTGLTNPDTMQRWSEVLQP